MADGDLALDSTGDLLVSGGDLVIVRGADSIASDLSARLQFIRGEWFLDTTAGLPYFETILVKNPQLPAVRESIRAEILATPGVASIESLELDCQPAGRTLVVQFEARLDTGQLVTNTVEVGF